ncbi:effector-associated domain 2-containing protein [Streptomyces chartreusis]|uniref:VMAP-C domain-containing protein n=1 Tax=Streptomyces chartreusis TaxID=1969 RepID=UPI0033E5B07F
MEKAAGLGEFGREPGIDPLFRLTEALCRMSCLEDQAGRIFFARLLSDQLSAHVDLRGTKQREDVVAMVQAALGVPEGSRALVDAVRVFEGSEAATELEELLVVLGRPAFVPALPGPLTQRDMNSALTLLDAVEGRFPANRLRDRLATELHHDLPVGLTPRQLFVYLAELNVQPDGLPPAVILVDQASEFVRAQGWRQALSFWADTWAERTGLLTVLEDRRTRRADAVPDPTIPRCLVLAVEPARDGSGEIVVRPWLNTVPGYWRPQPADPETTSLDDLGQTVERALRQVLRLSAGPHGALDDGGEPAPPYVEFVLPYDLLNHDVAGLAVRSGDATSMRLGLKYGVHLRSLERMRTDDVLVRAQWHERWHTLQSRGIMVHGWRTAGPSRLDQWQVKLAAEPGCTAAVLDAPDGGAATEALKAAIAEGIGLAIWDRRGEFPEERREVVEAVFAAVQRPARLPTVIHELRRRAELNTDGPQLVSRHIAFFWDDPNRLVDIQTSADHGLEEGYTIGYADAMDTIDSEETAV